MDSLPQIVKDKLIARVERLEECGYELRRPLCAPLRDGIYELRARRGNVQYRILYAFVGQNIVLLSHGCTKEKEVPPKQISRAVRNRDKYVQDRKAHTYVEEL